MYRVSLYDGKYVDRYEVGNMVDVMVLMNRLQTYSSRTAKVILTRDEEPGFRAEWSWPLGVWIRLDNLPMKTFYNLFEQAYFEGNPVWIFIKTYQREDARDLFIKARGKKTWMVMGVDNYHTGELPVLTHPIHATVYDGGTWREEKMDPLPIFRRGELIGWNRERIRKFSEGWTAAGGKEAILWALPTLLDDLETTILELQEQVRILGGRVTSPKRKKVEKDEYLFEV